MPIRSLCMFVLCTAALSAFAAEPDRPVFDIPELRDITIDGNAADWAERGFRVDILSTRQGEVREPADFDPRLRLGWNEQGLVVLVSVRDDAAAESPDEGPWAWDSVELFLAGGWESRQVIQIIVVPGIDPNTSKFVATLFDRRAETAKPVEFEAKAARTAEGYTVEALLPWDAVDVKPTTGVGVAFNAQVNDRDLRASGRRFETTWYPTGWAGSGPKFMHRLRLSDEASEPVNLAVADHLSATLRATEVVAVAAGSDPPGELVLRSGETVLSAQPFRMVAGRLTARGSVPLAPGETPEMAEAFVGGKPVHRFELGNATEERIEAVRRARLRMRAVFDGDVFPTIAFETPGWIECVLGPFTVETTYYDASYELVKKPTAKGRYLARMMVHSEELDPIDRWVTLCKVDSVAEDWDAGEGLVRLRLPDAFGVDPGVLWEQQLAADEFATWHVADQFAGEEDAACLLAALMEAEPGGLRLGGWDARTIDGGHRFLLKKKLGLIEHRYLTDLPPDYRSDANKRWPLILFLHGAGERGSDLERVRSHGPAKLGVQGKLPQFVVVSPQCDKGSWWSAAQVGDLLDEVMAKYRIDPDRVYLTGLSMGGFGSWNTGCSTPERFAAIAPICGGGTPAQASRLKDTPVWVFHGDADPVVDEERSAEMVEALEAAGGHVKYTVYPGVGHESWKQAYADARLYRWFLANERGKPIVMPDDME